MNSSLMRRDGLETQCIGSTILWQVYTIMNEKKRVIASTEHAQQLDT